MTDKHILIIDDDKELSDLLTEYLSAEGFKISCCYDGESGLEQAKKQNINLILLDVMMPKLTGFEVLKTLGSYHQTPILMLTAKGDETDRVLGLELGADDYLAKPFPMRELLARINAILRRVDIIQNQPIEAEFNGINSIEFNHKKHEVYCHNEMVSLTGTEYQILTYFVQNHGKVISKNTLSEQVLGRKLTPYDRSIDMHVSNIRRKLLNHCADDKFKTIRGSGYIFLSGDS